MKIWIIFFFSAAIQLSFGQKVEIAFRIPEKDLIPEGITYNPSTKTFYVSSISKRKIVSVDEQVRIKDFISSGQDGIGEVLGLKVAEGKLWACNNLTGDSSKQRQWSMSMIWKTES